MDIESLIQKRIANLRKKMQEAKLDAVIITKPENAFYFSNFNPVINSHPAFIVIPLRGEPCLLVHCIRYSHATEEGALPNVQCYGQWGAAPSLAMEPADALKKLLGSTPLRLGLELNDISVQLYKKIGEQIKTSHIENISQIVNMLKIRKDEYEISCIRTSAKLVDIGVKTAIQYLEKGYSEAAACTEGQYRMRRAWHENYPDAEVCGFGTSEGGMIDSLHVWCLSNEHIAYGCDCPKHYFPQRNDVSIVMAWAKTNGYHAENERTIAVGNLNGVREKAYEAMLEARARIFAILKPGVLFEELYSAATDVFRQYGFGDLLPGRVGHGVGNSAHEFPSLTKGNRIPLAPGMVITVEPGLMDKSWGGARHSDTVLITENGYEKLTELESDQITIVTNGRQGFGFAR